MKKMMQKLIALTAAMALVLSMTAMVCSASYEEENDISTYVADWEDEIDDNSDRN